MEHIDEIRDRFAALMYTIIPIDRWQQDLRDHLDRFLEEEIPLLAEDVDDYYVLYITKDASFSEDARKMTYNYSTRLPHFDVFVDIEAKRVNREDLIDEYGKFCEFRMRYNHELQLTEITYWIFSVSQLKYIGGEMASNS